MDLPRAPPTLTCGPLLRRDESLGPASADTSRERGDTYRDRHLLGETPVGEGDGLSSCEERAENYQEATASSGNQIIQVV